MINPAMKRAITIVQGCRRDVVTRLPSAWGRTLEQLSCTKWVANELLTRFYKKPEDPPLAIMEEFLYQMDEYSCKAKNRYVSYVFATAKDAAQWMIDILLTT